MLIGYSIKHYKIYMVLVANECGEDPPPQCSTSNNMVPKCGSSRGSHSQANIVVICQEPTLWCALVH